MPNKGKLVRTNGSNAQWMAQAIEVAIPSASQLIFKFMKDKANTMQQCCKILFSSLNHIIMTCLNRNFAL